MSRLMINGNGPLSGEIGISGAKNAALPILSAGILTPEVLELDNLPPVRDIETMCRLLSELGLEVMKKGEAATIDGSGPISGIAPLDLVKNMRASILVLGPLLARLGFARVSLPGGCAIGSRPVDLHLKALTRMGAEIVLNEGYIEARAGRLRGAEIFFDKVTVTGTENIMMAATLAVGTTILHNAAREPEVLDLAQLLTAMGARIRGQGTGTIVIEGVPRLHGARHHIIPDRIETGTYVCAAAITGGHVTLTHTRPDLLDSFLDFMSRAGLPFKTYQDAIELFPHRGLTATHATTAPYPDFPTDMQAQFMAVMTRARGTSLITENIFENRFMHVTELKRMGARIQVDGRQAAVTGSAPLSGVPVTASDLRASASLVLAALAASGTTTVHGIEHLDRGYVNLEGKLGALGAHIWRLGRGPGVPNTGEAQKHIA